MQISKVPRIMQHFTRFGVPLVLALLFGLPQDFVSAKDLIVELQKFETVSDYGTEWIDWKTLALEKRGRNLFVVSGDIAVNMNMGDKQQFVMQIFRDPDNRKSGPPMMTIAKPLCHALNDFKDTYAGLAEKSDLPADRPCPFPKNPYHIRDYVLDASFLPKSTPEGDYKIVCTFKDGDIGVAAFNLYVTVTKE